MPTVRRPAATTIPLALSLSMGARLARLALLAALAPWAAGALADDAPTSREFGPKAGKGRVVVVVSGQTGPGNYQYLAEDLAAEGYDAVLVDGNDLWVKGGRRRERLRAVIARAQASAHALPGKVGVVGFSLGGASTLTYAARMPEQVAAVVAYYPFTAFIENVPGFAAKIEVPTLLMAGVKDTYKECCRIETARKLAEAAAAVEGGSKVELVEYPDAEHGWVIRAAKSYRIRDAGDAFQRTLAHLRAHLAD